MMNIRTSATLPPTPLSASRLPNALSHKNPKVSLGFEEFFGFWDFVYSSFKIKNLASPFTGTVTLYMPPFVCTAFVTGLQITGGARLIVERKEYPIVETGH